MRERYGKYGVWGTETSKGETGGPGVDTEPLSFVGAWSGEWTLQTGTTGGTDSGQLHIPVDYAVVLYRIGDRTDEHGRPVHRLWLWTAAHPTQSDAGYGTTTLGGLSIGVSLTGGGRVETYAPDTQLRPEESPAHIELSKPPAPTALQSLPAGRIRPTPNTAVGSGGRFAVEWTGAHGTTVSVTGVCELLRDPDRDYEFTLTSEANGTHGTL